MADINVTLTTMAEMIKEYDLTISEVDKEIHRLLQHVEALKLRLAGLKFDRTQVASAWQAIAKVGKERQDDALSKANSRTGTIETNYSR